MKRTVALVGVLGLFLVPLLIWGCGGSDGDRAVQFVDPNLERAVRQAIAKPTGDIRSSDLAKLTELDLRQRQIADLEGIEYCSNLVALDLSNNRIQDADRRTAALTPLSRLTRLETLDLSKNASEDITALSGLTSLTTLDLSDNKIKDISALSRLTNLRILNLSSNDVQDIAVLSGLTNLTSLDLSWNWWARDMTPLSQLTKLRILNLAGNPITDLNPLSELVNLTSLNLRYTWARADTADTEVDLWPLATLTNLTVLDISGNCLHSTPWWLAGLISLERLNLSGCGGRWQQDLRPLLDLPNLIEVDLTGVPFSLTTYDHRQNRHVPTVQAQLLERLKERGVRIRR